MVLKIIRDDQVWGLVKDPFTLDALTARMNSASFSI